MSWKKVVLKYFEGVNDEQTEREKITQLGKKFKCSVCGKGAEVPFRDHEYGETVLNWSKPGDLVECGFCNKYACSDHIVEIPGYKHVCKKCAESGLYKR